MVDGIERLRKCKNRKRAGERCRNRKYRTRDPAGEREEEGKGSCHTTCPCSAGMDCRSGSGWAVSGRYPAGNGDEG